MNYKSIIRVVGVVIVAVVFCVGCSEKPDEPDDIIHNDTTKNPTGGNSLAGDWLLVSQELFGDIYHTSNDQKTFYSFKSSDDLLFTGFTKINDFWIESTESAKYRVKGDSVCLQYLQNGARGEGGYDEECGNYSISNNTLVIRSEMIKTCLDVANTVLECGGSVFHNKTFVRDSLENTKKLLSNVYRQDTALAFTDWMRPSESGTIRFSGSMFDDFDNVYTSNDYYGTVMWYTEGTRLTLVELECGRYETINDGALELCVSFSVVQEVTLEYELSNNNRTLRLRPVGATGWDVWTPRDDGMSKSRAQSTQKKGIRGVSSFKDLLRFRPH